MNQYQFYQYMEMSSDRHDYVDEFMPDTYGKDKPLVNEQ